MHREHSYVVLLFCALSLPCIAFAGTDEKIIFLHHSTGSGVYRTGGVEAWFDNYNQANKTSYDISERAYPSSPYSWSNYPYDYWNLWVNGMCDASQPGIECMDTLVASYDVIIYKHCYPGADINADTGNPDISSTRKTLENYKLQYRALRDMMDGYLNTKFIIWTLAPRHRLESTIDRGERSAQFVEWVKTDFLTEDGQSHPNIFIFDFWGNTAETSPNPPQGMTNFLRYDFERSHTDSDSHPNTLANETVGPIFAQFIVDSINADSRNVALNPMLQLLLLN